jgi:hypothetical protein
VRWGRELVGRLLVGQGFHKFHATIGALRETRPVLGAAIWTDHEAMVSEGADKTGSPGASRGPHGYSQRSRRGESGWTMTERPSGLTVFL